MFSGGFLSNEMLRFVKNGSLDNVEELLKCGADIHYLSSNDNDHILIVAARLKNTKLIDLLVSYGADVESALIILNQKIENEPREISREFYKDIVKTLLNHAMSVDLTSLEFLKHINDISDLNFVGVSLNGFPIKQTTLNHYCGKPLVTIHDVNALTDTNQKKLLTAQYEAMKKKNGVVTNDEGIVNFVPLLRAAERGDISAVEARLKANINPNSGLISPIVAAASNGHLKIVELLAKHRLIDKSRFIHAIYAALARGHDAVADFLSTQTSVNEDKLLRIAAKNGNKKSELPIIPVFITIWSARHKKENKKSENAHNKYTPFK